MTAANTTGENNTDTKNRIPVVTAVKPVRPPTSTPEVDSTKEVTVEVPIAAPTTVPTESANNARSTFSNSPSSFTRPVRLPTATKVPAVSKKSTNKNEKIATKAAPGFANKSEKPSTNAPTVSVFISKVIHCSGNAGIPSIPAKPQAIPTTAVTNIPINTAAGTFLHKRANVNKIPNKDNSTVGSAKSPNATNVDSFATMIPAFFKPTNAIKKPIPAPIASLSCFGIALMIILRIPVTEINKKNKPETNTAAKAACQLNFIVKQTV